MSTRLRPHDPSPRADRHVGVALIGVTVFALWALVSAARRPEPRASGERPHDEPRTEQTPTRPDPVAPEPGPAPVVERAADGLPILPRETTVPVPPGPVHPHPVTAAHLRIYRENNLLGALNGAMDEKDASGLRRLLEQYRAEYPDDPHELQQGYAVVADCLDHPGEAATARARQYYETETASTLRRYVRRYCFEGGS